jgi:hypothetical protein
MTAFGIDDEHLAVEVQKRVEARVTILAHAMLLSVCDRIDKPSCGLVGLNSSSNRSANKRSNSLPVRHIWTTNYDKLAKTAREQERRLAREVS